VVLIPFAAHGLELVRCSRNGTGSVGRPNALGPASYKVLARFALSKLRGF
jgi:hypothetical protein